MSLNYFFKTFHEYYLQWNTLGYNLTPLDVWGRREAISCFGAIPGP